MFGRSHILRSDDLALIVRSPGAANGSLLLYKTQNGLIATGLTGAPVVTGVPLTGFPPSPDPVVVGARLFETGNDVAVTLTYVMQGGTGTLWWHIRDLAGELSSGSVAVSAYNSDRLVPLAADLTGDGLDDLVVWASLYDGPEFGAAIIATAMDPTDPSKGLRFGPAFAPDHSVSPAPQALAKVTVAGEPRLMLLGNPSAIESCTNGFKGFALYAYSVDAQSLALSPVGAGWTPPATLAPEWSNGSCITIADMTAGRLSAADHDQLAVVYATDTGAITVLSVDLDASGNPVAKHVLDTTYVSGGGGAQIESDRFAWDGPFEQAALLVSNCFGCAGINTLRILSFDADLNITQGPVAQAVADNICEGEMVVGNFDRQQANPGTPPPDDIANPNLQIAVPFNNCSDTTYLRLFNVDPDKNFTISPVPGFGVDVSGGLPTSLAALDLQGRSLRVGVPNVITINGREQATLVLAAPNGFYAGYAFSSSTNAHTDTTSTTTW